MKKFLVVIVALLLFKTLNAQVTMRIDTIISPYFEFDYEDWLNSDPQHPLFIGMSPIFLETWRHYEPQLHSGSPRRLVQYNYIEGGADVYGIAFWASNYNWEEPIFPPDSLYLFDAMPDTFMLKIQMPIGVLDNSAVYDRWHQPERINFPYSCEDSMHFEEVPQYRSWRYFFDKPIHVGDSFYVGASDNSQKYMYMLYEFNHDTAREEGVTFPGQNPARFVYMNTGSEYSVYDSCWMPVKKVKVKEDARMSANLADGLNAFVTGEWIPAETYMFWAIVPLIGTYDTVWIVDTPACNSVTGFGIMSHFGDTVMLRWNPLEGRSEYQVSYGPLGTEPDSGTFETVTINRWRYIDTVHNGEAIKAHVRTVCRELDTLRYSEWSNGVVWQTRFCEVESHEEGGVRVLPNPATEKVEIVTSCGVKGIEVYGSNGKRWRDFPPDTTVFDVSDWAKGTYVVVIHTLSGSVTKKLVVE